jgi:hypothetical protein
MADNVAFVYSGSDLKRLRDYYDKPVAARIQLSNVTSLRRRQIQQVCPLWIDPEIDGYHRLLKKGDAWPRWNQYISQFKDHDLLADPNFLRKPDPARMAVFVGEVLEKCRKSEPAWITVPQLPLVGDSKRNKVNMVLAKATASWMAESKFGGRLVLPLIFTHQSQLKGKTQWGPKLKVARKWFDAVRPDMIWAVDSDLSDWKGSARFRDRFEALVSFHTDLKKDFPNTTIIAGPYWGINLVLWVRGLCDYPAINLGHGFSYRVSAGYIPKEPPRAVVALAPLRRLACYTAKLDTWLADAIDKLDSTDEAARQFSRLRSRFKNSAGHELAWNQAAEFYGEWLTKLNGIAPAGRSLALYQDLSSAYVLGKRLPVLPDTESPARSAGKIAEQLMLHCL